MGSGGWIVVLVILALALTTGFVVSSNGQLITENQTAHVALKGSVETVVTLSAQTTKDAGTILQLQTQVAEEAIARSTAQAQAKVVATQQAVLIPSGSMYSERGQVASGDIQPTPIPDTGGSAGLLEMIVATLGLGLFTGVVVAIYRLLKNEDARSGNGSPEAKPTRTYAADADVVYVKMSRKEASSYGRDQSKK